MVVEDIVVSGKKDVCDNFFAKLKERFPVKNQGVLKSRVLSTRPQSQSTALVGSLAGRCVCEHNKGDWSEVCVRFWPEAIGVH